MDFVFLGLTLALAGLTAGLVYMADRLSHASEDQR